MPGAIQISAANNIAFSGGSYTQLGAGGFGIGNDPNAHITGVGLGASNVAITDGYFTQVMGNSVCAGGVQANAHHPSDARMINSHITISGNIFYNSSSLFSSTVPIFVTYIQYSTISHNDLYISPYSGICHGYGWGSNDAGGSQTYIDRGLYNYQPLYQTPTTSQNNLIEGNLVHSFGLSHTDLGAYYTLSKSPSTVLRNNYAYDSSWYGSYLDEGSNSLTLIGNVLLTNGNWYNPNQGAANSGMHTGNNTLIDNYGHTGTQLGNAPGGSGNFGDTFIDNYLVSGLSQTSEGAQRAAYRAGILPGRRRNRPVSNPQIPDAYLSIGSENGYLAVNISNFDDVAFTGVTFSVSANSGGYTLVPVQVPNLVPPDSFALATYIVDGTPGRPSFSATVRYTNPRTGASNNLSTSGQPSISFNQPPPTSTSTSTSSGTGTGNTTTAPTTITSPPSTTTTTSSVNGGSVQTHWGQCGGNGWSGPTSCQPPYACSSQNPWYSQCL